MVSSRRQSLALKDVCLASEAAGNDRSLPMRAWLTSSRWSIKGLD
jgi:hypothetical protein